MATPKTAVIEYLFLDPSRWADGRLQRPVVTLLDVQQAIQAHNLTPGAEPLSERNPANFFKDFIRKLGSAERNWPARVLQAGYTGVQRTGSGDCFEFVPLSSQEQTTAFAVTGTQYPKNPATTKLAVQQTLSMDTYGKELARTDESWLERMAAMLQLPQAHLALHHCPQLPISQIGYGQSNMKLLKTELDAFYYGELPGNGIVLIPLEVKGFGDDVLESQILEQVSAVQNLDVVGELLKKLHGSLQNTLIIPMAMKLVASQCADNVPGSDTQGVHGSRLIYMAHYKPVPFIGECPTALTLYGETLFDLRPGIHGINLGHRKPDRAGRTEKPDSQTEQRDLFL